MARYFTLDEANAMLPALERFLERLKSQTDRMGSLYSDLREMKEASRVNGGHALGPGYLGEIARYASLIHQINDLGCILKDVDRGLVDFPFLKDGREVYLCWMRGEASIGWWHEREAGFAGRKPIDTL